MDEKTERPELGTTEAAVRSCVNLIALATHTDEKHLAYWLDCYFQLRVAHEGLIKKRSMEDLMIMPVAADLAQAYFEALGGRQVAAPTEETVEAPQPAAPAAPLASSRDAMSEGGSPEAAAAQKKNRAPLTVGERRKLQNAEKEKKRIQGRSDWREFKRATFARLQEARTAGLTVAQIAAAYGALTENTVLDILNAAPRPIEDYRALAAALDKLAEI